MLKEEDDVGGAEEGAGRAGGKAGSSAGELRLAEASNPV